MPIEEIDEDIVDTMDDYFDGRLEEIHTATPGIIEVYNPDTKRARVKPLVNLASIVGESIEYKPIDNVRIISIQSQMFSIEYEPKKGDGVLLIFCESGIGNYLNSQLQTVEADDQSRFSLTDAVAIPGLYPFRESPTPKVKLKINNDGTFRLEDVKGNTFLSTGTAIEINGNLRVLR